jgi:hypothetical protein
MILKHPMLERLHASFDFEAAARGMRSRHIIITDTDASLETLAVHLALDKRLGSSAWVRWDCLNFFISKLTFR